MLCQHLIVALLSTVAFAITTDDCPSGLTRDKYLKVHGDSCYRFELNAKKEFQDAQETCQRENGSLALVKSKDTNKFILSNLQRPYRVFQSPVWIGLRYSSQIGTFKWVDGSSLGYDNFPSKTFYRPNECIAVTGYTGHWGYYRCYARSFFNDERHYFICEYPASQTNTNTTNTTI